MYGASAGPEAGVEVDSFFGSPGGSRDAGHQDLSDFFQEAATNSCERQDDACSSGPPSLVTDSDDSSSECSDPGPPPLRAEYSSSLRERMLQEARDRELEPATACRDWHREPAGAATTSWFGDEDSESNGREVGEADGDGSDGESGYDPLREMMLERAQGVQGSAQHQGRRGRHVNRGKRLSHAEYAARAHEAAKSNSIGVPCMEGTCPFDRKCGWHFTPAMLLRATERVYGIHCGRGADDKPFSDPDYPEKETLRHKRHLVLSWVRVNAAAPDLVDMQFSVEGQGPVCAQFAKAAYHFGDNTWNTYLAAARVGTLQADTDVVVKLAQQLSKQRDDAAQFETVQWWRRWLELEDQAPNEPVILHRVVEWQSIFECEYVEDMRWWGSAAPLSRTRWTQLRKKALLELSCEYFGSVSECDRADVRLSADQVAMRIRGGGFGVPVTMLGLHERTKKSNFGSCSGCDAAKAMWLQYRMQRNRTIEGGQEIKAKIFAHLHEVKLEREVAMQWQIECASRRDWLYTLDDKCGSQFLHLPAPPGGKFNSFYGGAWQYRFAMQVNIYDNVLTRMSMVPPCLHTGFNFGTTAFFDGLARCAEKGKLGKHVYRQTDGGSDNECKETHAFHHALVSCGAVESLTWLQLRPKHSHNKCDRYNSMVKEAIWPTRGLGGGVDAPWDMDAIIRTALATQNGEAAHPFPHV